MAVPDRVLTNDDLAAIVATSDEWIVSRTGIRERRIAGPEEATSDLAIAASRDALADAGMQPTDVDLVLCATCTGDYLWPSTACLVQDGIGAARAAAFDLSAACAGFCYGLEVAASLIESGAVGCVLLVGADTLTKHLDWADRSTCVLFGDGAGAVVLTRCSPGYGVLGSTMGADGSHARSLYVPAGGTRMPLTADMIAQRKDKMLMRGAEVFRFAVRIMGEACLAALRTAHLSSGDVNLFIPHQANIRIIRAAAQRMGLSEDRMYNNVERYGNTSAASVPIALTEAVRSGRARSGDVLVFVGFGAGLTWGANVVRWCRNEACTGTAS
jgi:3-oxoacyl-[acyl-carrier-protein] synthase-3